MFVEPHIRTFKNETGQGWIEVICGPMFSGKTEELIRRLNRAIIAGQRVEIFKPKIDKRYDLTNVVSHNQTQIRSTPVGFANEILLPASDSEVVGIDEAQFFDEDIVNVARLLADKGKRVVVAGLDLDSRARPFGKMPELLAYAEYVTKLHAICVKCGALAARSYRHADESNPVMVGAKEMYEPRCRRCYNLGKDAKKII
jgi:thymidine kinase